MVTLLNYSIKQTIAVKLKQTFTSFSRYIDIDLDVKVRILMYNFVRKPELRKFDFPQKNNNNNNNKRILLLV